MERLLNSVPPVGSFMAYTSSETLLTAALFHMRLPQRLTATPGRASRSFFAPSSVVFVPPR
jgi:hypothetical protein